jgi:hypothetical protein
LTIYPKSHTLKLSRIGCGLFAMAEKVPTINLLPNTGDSLMTQFFNWALSIGRLLIIITEMVALATFLYRFGLDMQIVDLHDKISEESNVVANFKVAETTFRDIQDRLAVVRRYSSIGQTTSSTFTKITSIGLGKVTFKDLTITTQEAKIEVESQTPTALSQFVDSLKNDPSITAVSIDKVQDNTSSAQILVDITATLKPNAFEETEQETDNQINVNQSILNQ